MSELGPASRTRAFVEQLWEVDSTDATPEDRERLLALLVDHIAVAAGGSVVPSARVVREVLRAAGSAPGGLPVVASEAQLGVVDAAVANAVSAHSLDYDDIHSASSCHIGVIVFPAALAAATLAKADAPTFLTGIMRGYEAVGRIGRAARPAELYARGLHPTAVVGHFGAAIAAASILGLDSAAATSAVGIVAPAASGTMQFLDEGDWTKRLNPGIAVRNGLTSALLARAGYVGGSDGLLGPHGFLTLLGATDGTALLEGGRQTREIGATSIKPHACCRYNQSAIDAALALRTSGAIAAENVASVRVGILSVAKGIVCEPVNAKRRPQNVVDAQFSLPYGVAVAIIDGAAGPKQYTAERLHDARLSALIDRVECLSDASLDERYPEIWPAWVWIRDRDGHEHEMRVDHPHGDPENPLSPEELHAKFDGLAATYPPEVRGGIWEACREIVQGTGSVSTLLAALRVSGGR